MWVGVSVCENNDQKVAQYEKCSQRPKCGHSADNNSTVKYKGVGSPSQPSARYEKCSLMFLMCFMSNFCIFNNCSLSFKIYNMCYCVLWCS